MKKSACQERERAQTDSNCDQSIGGESSVQRETSVGAAASDAAVYDIGESSAIASSDSRSVKVNKKFKPNTTEQKKRMRNERKKRKRKVHRCGPEAAMAESNAAILKFDLHKEQEQCKRFKAEAGLYKNMARTYWDRWQWELQKRRECLHEQCRPQQKGSGATAQTRVLPAVHEINPTDLKDPVVDGVPTEIYVGRGSFSVVRLRQYRGIQVAVKEFLSRTVKEDVKNEAAVLARLCHPFLPHLFGICVRSNPMKIIIQFHGISNTTITLGKQIVHRPLRILEGAEWLILTTQLLEAVEYLHDHAHTLHNDIKHDNILITEDVNGDLLTYHIVLVDFGKATALQSGRHYTLSEREKVEYLVKYPHIAPEVVHGEYKQSTHSDMYSVGIIYRKISDNNCFSSLPSKTLHDLKEMIQHCLSVRYLRRPSASRCLEIVNKLF